MFSGLLSQSAFSKCMKMLAVTGEMRDSIVAPEVFADKETLH